jgi:hypothetical protein
VEHEAVEDYKGRRITVEAQQGSKGWGWSYLIDGKNGGSSTRQVCATAEAALRQGLAAARDRVEKMG